MTDPIAKACLPRTRANLLAAVKALDVEHAEKYRRRDVTGDGIPETWCNVYVEDLLESLGIIIPRLTANDLADWLPLAGRLEGWISTDQGEAQWCAERGCGVLGVWKNPGAHGHVALAVPSDAPGLHVTAAGRTNHASCLVVETFGPHSPLWYAHP